MSHQRRCASSTSISSSSLASASSSSSATSFFSSTWIYFWCNAKAIVPFFVTVRVGRVINYCTPSEDLYHCSSGKRKSDSEEKTGGRDRRSGCCQTANSFTGKSWKIRKMAQFMSKGLALLGFAFTVHFILISTLADKGSLEEDHYASWPGASGRGVGDYDFRRRPRSYRSDRESKPIALANTVGPGGLVGAAVPSRLASSSSFSGSAIPDKSDALFATENSTVVTAQIGSTANLPCVVKNLGNGVASWIRRHDYHLLTVGMGTYSNDDRFVVSHNRPNQNWELHVKFVKPSDEGMYECQISTHPPSSIFIRLRVVEARAEILGEPDKHVRAGSTFELVCVLRDSTEPPVYVFWYHNDRMINYDNERGVVVSSDVEKSVLTIQEAQKSDSGNYTCQPSNASPSWIVVHILNGEKPAAMQHGSRNAGIKIQNSSSPSSLFLFISILSLLLTRWLTRAGFQVSSLKMDETICDDDDENSSEHPNRRHYHPRRVIPARVTAVAAEKCSTGRSNEGNKKKKMKIEEPAEEHQFHLKVRKVKSNFEQAQIVVRLSHSPVSKENSERGTHNCGGGELGVCCERRRHGGSITILDSLVRSDDGPTATSATSSRTSKVTSSSPSCSVVSCCSHVNSASFPLMSTSFSSSSSSSSVFLTLSSSPSSFCYRGPEHETDCRRSCTNGHFSYSSKSYQNSTSVVVPVLVEAR